MYYTYYVTYLVLKRQLVTERYATTLRGRKSYLRVTIRIRIRYCILRQVTPSASGHATSLPHAIGAYAPGGEGDGGVLGRGKPASGGVRRLLPGGHQ